MHVIFGGLNNQRANISYTIDKSKNTKQFLNVVVQINDKGVDTWVWRKPTCSAGLMCLLQIVLRASTTIVGWIIISLSVNISISFPVADGTMQISNKTDKIFQCLAADSIGQGTQRTTSK